MALLTGYAPRLPLWIRHSARARGGRLLVPRGDCHPRQDHWAGLQQGVTLGRRFLASAANSASSVVVSAYSAVATRGAGSFTAKKNLLLQHSARAQTRLFSSPIDYLKEGEGGPVDDTELFSQAINQLQDALELEANHPDRKSQTLDALGVLKAFAGTKDYYNDDYKATQLLEVAVSPLALLGSKHGGGSNLFLDLDDDVVKESLAVTCLLLRNAPAEIGTKLCSKISQEKGVKTSLERIRDRGSGSEMGKLANEILTQIPSTPN